MHILILEDDQFYIRKLKEVCQEYGLVTILSDPEQARSYIKSTKIDLLISDIDLNHDLSGLDIAKIAIKNSIPTFILSSLDTDELVEQAYDIGCVHFLQKKQFVVNLKNYLNSFINITRLNYDEIFQNQFITQNSELKNTIKKVLNSKLKDKTILITGETGTGKTELAKILHQRIYDNKAPFIHLNCSEITENLLESELFGHEKGSFTGADNKKVGKLELACDGTLFLDEMGSMSYSMQQKLLRVLEEKSFYPVGSTKKIHTRFTLISATCDDLKKQLVEEKFRKDLFFRISGYDIDIAPLRKRKDDIKELILHFKNKSPRKVILKSCAMAAFQAYSWPGNIRELKKIIEQLIDNTNGIITEKDFKECINTIFSESNKSSLLSTSQKEFILSNGLRSFISNLEQEIIQDVFKKNHGKITHCIKDLKISSSAFYRMLEKSEIN